MLRYNWEYKEWPNFKYSTKGLEKTLLQISRNEGKYDGIVNMLPENVKADAIIDLMVIEAIKSSEIEGEFYSRKDVLSSIKKNLGLHQKSLTIINKNAEGISKIMVDIRTSFAKPLTKAKLFEWHQMLFNTYTNIEVGKWRTHIEPMQIVSGAYGKQKVHFEAPPSRSLEKEMKGFIQWFNNTAPNGKQAIENSAVRAALVHLYFESIHPFEDGNGRIGRVLAEKVLSQGMKKPALLSLSATIEKNKKKYYAQLQVGQKNLNATQWVHYFVNTILKSQEYAEKQIEFTINKASFFDSYKAKLNARQLKAIKKIMEEGPDGFKGGLNATKYKSINKTSKATATRDLQELVELGIIIQTGGGRSTSYRLKLDFKSEPNRTNNRLKIS
jgi:Fic family protein